MQLQMKCKIYINTILVHFRFHVYKLCGVRRQKRVLRVMIHVMEHAHILSLPFTHKIYERHKISSPPPEKHYCLPPYCLSQLACFGCCKTVASDYFVSLNKCLFPLNWYFIVWGKESNSFSVYFFRFLSVVLHAVSCI
jgi:hypothetical protein